jgi:hypothetical protein
MIDVKDQFDAAYLLVKGARLVKATPDQTGYVTFTLDNVGNDGDGLVDYRAFADAYRFIRRATYQAKNRERGL